MPRQASDNSAGRRYRPAQSKYHLHDDGVSEVQVQSRGIDKQRVAAGTGNAISDFSM